MGNYGGDDIDQVITGGIVFHGASKKSPSSQTQKVKTKTMFLNFMTNTLTL